MSQRVYMALTWGEAVPVELNVWSMAERFGWTLDYIESLPLSRWHEFIQIEDGRAHARNSLTRKKGK